MRDETVPCFLFANFPFYSTPEVSRSFYHVSHKSVIRELFLHNIQAIIGIE